MAGFRPNSRLVPITLCCLGLIFWSNVCWAKSSRFAKNMDGIEPPEGLEWLNNGDGDEQADGFVKRVRRKPIQQKRRGGHHSIEEDDIQVDFGPLRGEGLRRFKNSYSLFEVEEEDDEQDEDGDELEEGEPIPWFGEWQKMIVKEKRKTEEEKKRGMRELKPAKKGSINHYHSSSTTSQRHRLASSSSPLPNARLPSTGSANRRFRNLREGQPCLLKRKNLAQHRTYPRSYEFPGFELSVPREWDWRNVSGVNYCSPNRNQHIPVYCGGCWVFGTLGALNDRFNVARKNRWPMTFLSPQEIIACNGRGNCSGGTAEDVFEHAKTVGLVEEGCNNFKAVSEKCTPFTRCGSCWPDNCFAIQNYTRYYIKDFGKLNKRLEMMSEIHNRGPIACTVGCTANFDMNYTRGIYQEFGDFPPNHIVSVTGWGWEKESKTEYWIVRNSWGDAWGENGWFRIVTSLYNNGRGDQYNLGIERDCYFADPDVSNLDI